MSLWRDEIPASRLSMAAAAALGLLAIASLGRVFSSPIYLAWALPAAAVSYSASASR